MAVNGPDVLYNGSYTAGLVADITAAGGIITKQDLGSAAAAVEQPIVSEVLGMQAIMPGPPSSAAVLVPALNMLAGYKLPATAAGVLVWHRYACGWVEVG